MGGAVVVLQTPGDLLARYVATAQQLAVFAVTFLALYVVGVYLVVPAIRRVLTTRRLDPTIGQALVKLLRVVVVFVAAAFAFGFAGFGNILRASATLAAALTVAIGFATRDIASNLISGVFIVTDPQFNIGDWIEWTGKRGVIEDISFRVTRVRTFDNELITVPNSQLAMNAVTNPVSKPHLRLTHEFTVGYRDDLDTVETILLSEAERHDDVRSTPEPSVRVRDVNDDSVDVAVHVWVRHPTHTDVARIRSEYLRRVKRRFVDHDITLPAQ